MAIPKDPVLYKKVKKLADRKFLSKTGIYKSSWIVREYKKRGGTYSGSKSNGTGIKRWYREKWVDLKRPNSKGGYAPCGRASASKGAYPLCRPSKRISSKTPRTYTEISKKSLSKAKCDKKGSKRIYIGGGAGAQYYGKSSKIMIKVPTNVKKWAKYAFKLQDIGFRGATSTGWKRAKQLATRESIPIEDLRYMRNWYARHYYTSYPGFKAWEKAGRPKDSSWHNKHAIVSWVTWGATAGLYWVNSDKVIRLLNHHYNKNYGKI